MKNYEYISIFAGLLTGFAFLPQLIKSICLGGKKESALSNLGLFIYLAGISLWIAWGAMLFHDTLNDDEPGYNGLISIIFSCVSFIAILLTITFNVPSLRKYFYGRYLYDSNSLLNKFCNSKRTQKFLQKT